MSFKGERAIVVGEARAGRRRWSSYVERYRNGEWRDRIFYDMILEDARKRHGPLTFLDIGCGRGFDGDVALQRSLAAVAGKYVGVEPDLGVVPGDYFSETHRCLFEAAPLPADSVDIAFAIMVLEHLASPRDFWNKLHDVLAKGGVFWALTVDARHWFCRLSLWAKRLQVKDLYLNHLLGDRGTERYENYPVYYRSNSPSQIAPYLTKFHSWEVVNFSQVGQCNYYLPRPLRPIATFLDRCDRHNEKPGALLAIRVVK